MISLYIQEQRRYAVPELTRLFSLPEEKLIPLLHRLRVCNLVKVVRATDDQRSLTDLAESDLLVAEPSPGSSSCFYVFTFVGVIVISGRLLKCYPKYLARNARPVREMKQVLKVLEKYSSREQLVRLIDTSDSSDSFSLLSVMLSLLSDYHEHGAYDNPKEIIENNGGGEILWDKTINETFALLTDNRAYYFDLQTRKRIQDDRDFFHRLHECVLTDISNELKQTELPQLFDIGVVSLSEEFLPEFGDVSYILDRIEKELNVEFNTRKQYVLKAVFAYLSRQARLTDSDCLALFGTNSFNLVWEAVCADVLNNQLYAPLGSLPLTVPLRPGYRKSDKLIEIIEKPYWSGAGSAGEAANTLIPDAAAFERTESGCVFLIYDAKYYAGVLEAGKPVSGLPGIESISKQYLYQLAFQRFLDDHKVTDVVNCFLLPTAGETVLDKGTVSLPMVDALGLRRIQVRFVPAMVMFDYYLNGKRMNPHDLRLPHLDKL